MLYSFRDGVTLARVATISLCVITGNEEHAVETFLDSFSGAFDELCMVRAVGTVAHDRTLSKAKEWCGKHGKRFVAGEYKNAANPNSGNAEGIDDNNPATWPHVDDFAAARNVAWNLATCEWQLWADLDDVLMPKPENEHGGAELVRLCAASNQADRFFFTYSLGMQSEQNVRERLFRRGISQWVQPVHEMCVLKNRDEQRPGIIETRVVYQHAPTQDKQRDPMRNRRIMAYHTRWIHAYAFELHREWFYQWQVSRAPEDAEKATTWAEIACRTECLPEQRFDMLLHQAQIAAQSDIELAIDLCWQAIRINPKNRNGWGDLATYSIKAGKGGLAAVHTEIMQTMPKPPPSGYQIGTRFYGWEGLHLRLMSLRAAGQQDRAREMELTTFRKNGARISLIHATRGRAKHALACRNIWMKTAAVPLGVEHVFAIDADDHATLAALQHHRHVVVNEPNGCVKAWNAAAAESSGEILIQLSDDWLPCANWDDMIVEAFAGTKEPRVLAIDDGQRKDALLCMAVLNRARYEAQGREMFSPEYFGVFSDNEFTVRAYDDGCVIQAQHIQFRHCHPIFDGKPVEQWDDTHRRQNAPERYAHGLEVFNRRNPKHAVK